MEALVNRVHGILNLILLASLLALWPLTNESQDVSSNARDVMDVLGNIKDYWEEVSNLYKTDPQIQQYFRGLRSEDSPTSPEERRDLVRHIPVSQVLRVAPLLTERDLEEPRERYGEWDSAESREELESWIRLLMQQVPEIERVYLSSGLGADSTVADLEETVKKMVRIPVVNESVPIGPALLVIAIGLVFLSLYLVSLLLSLRSAIGSTEVITRDLIFLHSGPIGVPLGIAWISLPIFVLGYAMIDGYLEWCTGAVLLLALGCLSCVASVIAIQCRVKMQQQVHGSAE